MTDERNIGGAYEEWLDPNRRPGLYNQLDWARDEAGLQAILDLASPNGIGELNDKVLIDIGTGTGHVLTYIAPYVREAIGVDISPAMLQQADLRQNVRLITADVTEKLALPDGSADVVTTRMMLHGLTNMAAVSEAISEMWRLVRPGGRFIASEYVLDTNWVQSSEYLQQLLGKLPTLSVLSNYVSDSNVGVLNYGLFTAKGEPRRFLWTDDEFAELVVNICKTGVGEVIKKFCILQHNSVGNWLRNNGLSDRAVGFALMQCMWIPHWAKPLVGMQVSVGGNRLSFTEQDSYLYDCMLQVAAGDVPDFNGLDVAMDRKFANVAVVKEL